MGKGREGPRRGGGGAKRGSQEGGDTMEAQIAFIWAPILYYVKSCRSLHF